MSEQAVIYSDMKLMEGTRKKGEPLGLLFWICVGWIASGLMCEIMALTFCPPTSSRSRA